MLENLSEASIGKWVKPKGEMIIGTLTAIFEDGTVEVDWGRINHNCIIGKELHKIDVLEWYERP